MLHAFISKKAKISTKNTLAVKKVVEKGCDEKYVKSKGSSQGLCRNAVDHIIMMIQATKH